jgi:hypothetical protein
VCHAEAALEAWAEDEAARELMALLAGLDAEIGRLLVAYLGLFRPPRRALAWARALRIARETLALDGDAQRLSWALDRTVEAMRQKRDGGDIRPLENHNYLKRVLDGAPSPASDMPGLAAHPAPPARGPSATVDGVMRLEALKRRARGDG